MKKLTTEEAASKLAPGSGKGGQFGMGEQPQPNELNTNPNFRKTLHGTALPEAAWKSEAQQAAEKALTRKK